MEEKAPLIKRSFAELNEDRRRLLLKAYACYPEYVYCDADECNWHTSGGRTIIFDLYYLGDSGLITLIGHGMETHRKPEFYMLTPAGIDLIEAPGEMDRHFPIKTTGKGKMTIGK